MPHVRSIFLSDIHLGTRACQAQRLVDFLREYESDYLFLVGDIVDLWVMSRGVYWSAAQNTVVQKVLKRARHGARVVLVPGNHDEALREYVDTSFGDIHLVRECIHTAADGRRYAVLHGDEFDQVTRYHRWVAVLGDRPITRWYASICCCRCYAAPGVPGYWSLAATRSEVKSAVSFIYNSKRRWCTTSSKWVPTA
jgi:UDP-2,3-diacylglucosamine pyrophosphatase LpxH